MSIESNIEKKIEYPVLITKFIDNLQNLKLGEIACLRRNAGSTIAESRNCLGLFYRFLPYEVSGKREEELYFLVATLYGLNGYVIHGDFGVTMKEIKLKTNSENIDRRMLILLDSRFGITENFHPGGGEMAYRLRQCIKLADSHQIGVDWEHLLYDLTYWSWPEKKVQKQWARAYFGTPVK